MENVGVIKIAIKETEGSWVDQIACFAMHLRAAKVHYQIQLEGLQMNKYMFPVI